ncbi:ABC transporter substrate binding protein [Marispirochaeta sp.]|uniref:ABC transporter substrate-binding protein n=1 Tax=Marispirochaeta sp. TaxID=2038653 RepID=UPI0029C697C0|nr:ABC transporter substrate binding protein [Marispirochaeta sp.]
MNSRNSRYFFIAIFILLAVLAGGVFAQEGGPARILHIMSYHAQWPWNNEQLAGFRAGLAIPDAEIRIVELDAKRQSSPEQIEAAGRSALKIISEWKPDLIYLSDDDALDYMIANYHRSDIPVVFSGINAPAEAIPQFMRAWTTGVLEIEHALASIRLLQAIQPAVRKLAIVTDESSMWDPVVRRLREVDAQLPEIEIVRWDIIRSFEEYKRRILEYQNTVDAIGLLGIFLFKDMAGSNVSYTDVLRWTAENSNLPDFTYWKDRIQYGTLCSVTVSGYEQGIVAGRKAREILLGNRSPEDIPINATLKGEPVISLARARSLGISLRSDLLLSSEIFTDYAWND